MSESFWESDFVNLIFPEQRSDFTASYFDTKPQSSLGEIGFTTRLLSRYSDHSSNRDEVKYDNSDIS